MEYIGTSLKCMWVPIPKSIIFDTIVPLINRLCNEMGLFVEINMFTLLALFWGAVYTVETWRGREAEEAN